MRPSVVIVFCLVGLALWWWSRPHHDCDDAHFGSVSDLKSLLKHEIGGLVLGNLATNRWRMTRHEIQVTARESVLILGPTQSGKTSSLVIPAILRWDGPILAASVKDDLVRATLDWRTSRGSVGIVDPHFAKREFSVGFDPVALTPTWQDARRISSSLMAASLEDQGGSENQFWAQLGAKFLGPLFLAAAIENKSLPCVTEWIDHRESQEPLFILEDHQQWEARDALTASIHRDERQLSSVYATIEAALEPLVLEHASTRRSFDPVGFLQHSETLYLCAPAHDQVRYRPLFSALTSELITQAFSLARHEGGSLSKPLLIILDEAAAIAPLKELDVLAATCASHGITLMTCFQDLAQIRARYGERWGTVVNNHRTRVFLAGLVDSDGGSFLQSLAGMKQDHSGTLRSKNEHQVIPPRHALIEPNDLRTMPLHRGLVVSGSLPAFRIVLKPWWKDQILIPRGHQSAGGYARNRDHLRRHGSPLDDRSNSSL